MSRGREPPHIVFGTHGLLPTAGVWPLARTLRLRPAEYLAHLHAISLVGLAVIDGILPERVAAVCATAELAFKMAEDHRRRRAASVDGKIRTETQPVAAPPARSSSTTTS